MQVHCRQSALSGGWSTVYTAEAIVSTRMDEWAFYLSSVEQVTRPGASLRLKLDAPVSIQANDLVS